jgi:hypothetical protein
MLHIFNVTGQLFSKIGVKLNLAATDPIALEAPSAEN